MRTAFVVFFVLCVNSAFGQSVADIKAKYGKPMEVYSVSERIWMTPEFGADNQGCEMRLYPKRIGPDTNYLSQKLPFEELTKVLNAIVPPYERGAKKQSFGATATGGPAAWTTYGYENVTFTFVSSFSTMKFDEGPPLKRGEFVFSPPEIHGDEELESSVPAENDFWFSKASPADIVTIRWNGRKCGSK